MEGEEEGAEEVGEVGIVTEVTAMDMMEGAEEGLLVAAAVSTGELSRSHSPTSRLNCRGGLLYVNRRNGCGEGRLEMKPF